MQDRIIEFTNVLRRNGLRVSLSENIDAFRAIALLGIEDASQFRAALRTTLVKRAIDLRPFDELFDLFFLGIGRTLNQADQQLMEQLGLSPQEFQELLDRIDRFLKQMEGELSDLTRALLSGNKGELERLLRHAARRRRARDERAPGRRRGSRRHPVGPASPTAPGPRGHVARGSQRGGVDAMDGAGAHGQGAGGSRDARG